MTPAALACLLRERAREFSTLPVVTGFDGFVDEMIDLVGERTSLEAYTRVETIDTFGDLVKAAAGHSSLREIVIKQTDPGGCAINMGDSLANFGVPVTTFATAGEPVHPAFSAYAEKATLHSWGAQPGRTLAFEFADGKLMFSSVQPLAEFTPAYVAGQLSKSRFGEACKQAQLIAITDWTLYPHMTACWKVIREMGFADLSHQPFFFFDLVDPASRSKNDIRDMLKELSAFSSCGRVTLGLNQNEANILSRCIGIDQQTVSEPTAQAAALREAIGIQEVVIHAHKFAVLATGQETARAEGPYCPQPKKSTGAGDRFNAGYALGLLLGLDATDRLLLGNATSGLYVRLGVSPTLDQLVDFLDQQQLPVVGAGVAGCG